MEHCRGFQEWWNHQRKLRGFQEWWNRQGSWGGFKSDETFKEAEAVEHCRAYRGQGRGYCDAVGKGGAKRGGANVPPKAEQCGGFPPPSIRTKKEGAPQCAVRAPERINAGLVRASQPCWWQHGGCHLTAMSIPNSLLVDTTRFISLCTLGNCPDIAVGSPFGRLWYGLIVQSHLAMDNDPPDSLSIGWWADGAHLLAEKNYQP